MGVVIVYESMFGGTRSVAESLARGLERHTDVTLVNVNDAGEKYPNADLVLVGGPTHTHGLSSSLTREEAVRWSKDPDRKLVLEHGAPGIGIREWLEDLSGVTGDFVAFDTRADALELLTGSAAKHIQKELRKLGGSARTEPESFLVHDNVLEPAETARAEALGEKLGRELAHG